MFFKALKGDPHPPTPGHESIFQIPLVMLSPKKTVHFSHIITNFSFTGMKMPVVHSLLPQFCQIEHTGAWFGKPSLATLVSACMTGFAKTLALSFARSSIQVLYFAKLGLASAYTIPPP